MIKRILCPFHKERTPSLVVYETGYNCYGCGKYGPLTDLGMNPEEIERAPRYVENVNESIEHIQSLPLLSLRGLQFHGTDDYYYVLWPGGDYYNRRSRSAGITEGAKYKCPSGVSKPLFQARVSDGPILLIVEGEINALSLASVSPEVSIVSPGGTGDFYGKGFERNLGFYKRFNRVILMADRDKAGAIACIELKARLVKFIPDVDIVLMPIDANEILVKYGKEKIRETLAGVVMSRKLPDYEGAVLPPGEAAPGDVART